MLGIGRGLYLFHEAYSIPTADRPNGGLGPGTGVMNAADGISMGFFLGVGCDLLDKPLGLEALRHRMRDRFVEG